MNRKIAELVSSLSKLRRHDLALRVLGAVVNRQQMEQWRKDRPKRAEDEMLQAIGFKRDPHPRDNPNFNLYIPDTYVPGKYKVFLEFEANEGEGYAFPQWIDLLKKYASPLPKYEVSILFAIPKGMKLKTDPELAEFINKTETKLKKYLEKVFDKEDMNITVDDVTVDVDNTLNLDTRW